jgi:hypothetical protein
VVALYVSGVVWLDVLKQTAVADAASVIVGSALTVTVKLDVVLVQELAFLTVRFPV